MRDNLAIRYSTGKKDGFPWELVFKGNVISKHRTRSEAQAAYDRTSSTLDIKK